MASRAKASKARPPATSAGALRVRNDAAYEAASTASRRALGWRSPTASPNSILGNLTTLRDRSRAATRNDGYAKGVIDKLVTNIIGTGINPLSQAVDPAFRRQVQDLWLRWTDESDADGLLDWFGQQTQGIRAWLEGGEAFVRRRPRLPKDGLAVPLQIQVLEPELCPLTYNAVLANGAKIRAGIEFNAIGRRVAYWFHPQRPGDYQDFDPSQLVRVPADSVTHLFDPLRPGQLRGVPHLTQALIKLYELDKFDDATLLRQQLANLFVGFVTRETPEGDEANLNPLNGQPVVTDLADKPMLALEPGLFQELSPGEDVKFSQPPGTGDGYADFMRQQLYGVSAATGVPYEVLTGDMSRVNDRTVRVILHEFRRRVQSLQHQIAAFQLCRPVWRWWFDAVFYSGALPIPPAYLTDPTPWAGVKWMPQGWPYLHPVQDVQASKDAIRGGFTSRSAEVSERGEDSAVIDAEQAADNERADALGLRYDSDGRQDLKAPAAGALPLEDPSQPPPGASQKNNATEPPQTGAPPIHVEVHPSPVHVSIEPGAVQVSAPVTVDARTSVDDGAFRFDHHAGAVDARTTIAEGAVQSSVSVDAKTPAVRMRRQVTKRDAHGRPDEVIETPVDE